MDLSTKVALSITGTATKDSSLGTTASATPKIKEDETLADGTDSGQADKLYHISGTLAASGDQDYDLSGSLTDIYGDAITFTKIKAIMIRNTSDELGTPTTAEIQFGGGDTGDGTNAWDTWITSTAANGSEAVKVPAGGALALYAPQSGYAVTAGTADILRIKNNDGSDQAQYELLIVGVQA